MKRPSVALYQMLSLRMRSFLTRSFRQIYCLQNTGMDGVSPGLWYGWSRHTSHCALPSLPTLPFANTSMRSVSYLTISSLIANILYKLYYLYTYAHGRVCHSVCFCDCVHLHKNSCNYYIIFIIFYDIKFYNLIL